MSIFSRQISKLATSDLDELLAERAVESVRLEFKPGVPDKDETLKKMSSFANTMGGYMVVGATAKGDGRINGIPGVAVEAGYKQKIVEWSWDAVSPPMTVEVSDPIPAPSGSGPVAYVIYVPESDLAPHFLNGRKGVYVRTDEFSKKFEPRLATQAELLQLLERRKVVRERRDSILQRARDRFRTFFTASHSKEGRKPGGIGARFSLSIVPRHPARAVWEQGKLFGLLETKRLPWRQLHFPQDAKGIVSQHESVIVLNPGSSFSILEANCWGLLFYATEMELEEHGYRGIHLNHFLGQLAVFLEYARLMVKEAGLAGPIIVTMTLDGIRGAQWLHFGARGEPMQRPGSVLDDTAEVRVEATAEELAESIHRLMMELLAFTSFATNWPEVALNRQSLWAWVKMGYIYNMQPEPQGPCP